MSAMMAAGTSGPTPVNYSSAPGAPQQRGHSRNPSNNNNAVRGAGGQQQQHQPLMQAQGESGAGRRDTRARSNSQTVPQQNQHPQQAGGGMGNSEGAYARVAPQQPKVNTGSTNQPRVHAPRPTTSTTQATGGAQTAGPSAQRPSASSRARQPEPMRPTEQPQPQTQGQVPSQSQRHAQFQAQPQQASSSHPATSAAPNPATSGPPGSTSSRQPGQTVTSSFPHAFERWERLSSRWEGLTGYWISRLEHNREELKHLPLEQEMARQISDLSTAGANLFQAVVELQRLRASSERKFQRWFFDTKSDQERAKEMSSELERSLRVERQKRADALTKANKLEAEKATAEKLVEEMRRELQISREECRRAWEELGRREQEERERTNSLREGHPTLVGGVQVLPMPMPGVPMPSRSGSGARPRTSSSSHAGGSAQPDAQQYQEHYEYGYGSSPVQSDLGPSATLHHEPHIASPAHAQPTSTGAASGQSPGIPGTPSPSYPPPQTPQNQQSRQQQQQQQRNQQKPFYQQEHAAIHLPAGDPSRTLSPGAESGSYIANPALRTHHSGSVTVSDVSDGGLGEAGGPWEFDEHGNVVLDEQGHPLPAQQYQRREPSRAEMEEEEEEEPAWDRIPDYGGAAYGDNGGGVPVDGGGYGPGWGAIPRAPHHHPTRLSDVPEEEEERRTQMGSEGGRMSR